MEEREQTMDVRGTRRGQVRTGNGKETGKTRQETRERSGEQRRREGKETGKKGRLVTI